MDAFLQTQEDVENARKKFGHAESVATKPDGPRFILTTKMQVDFLESLQVSKEDIQAIQNYEQRTKPWFMSREGRMTGSIIGSIVGHNFFNKPSDKLHELLWGTFTGNEATKWGTRFEPVAATVYEEKTANDVDYPGLIVCKHKPWLGYSPDGIFTVDNIKGLLEIKCPFKKKLYGRIPMYYYDQIQYGMWLLNCEYADFLVFTPEKCSLQRFDYNKAYCEEFLIPAVERFYFNRFLPLFLLQKHGILQTGQTAIPDNVIVEPLHEAPSFS